MYCACMSVAKPGYSSVVMSDPTSFFAPRTQQFAIVGDTGIHEKCGQPFWEEISALLSARFKEGQFTEALVAAVAKVGEVLARHFPRRPDDQNELPNQIVRG